MNARAAKAPARRLALDLELSMNVIVFTPPLLALIAGVVILIVPRVLNYVIAAYLILIGLLGLFPQLFG